MGLTDNFRFVVQKLSGRRSPCAHGEAIRDVEPESLSSCPQCVAAGDDWKGLRFCATCGQVGCCDSSKNKHARRHALSAHHPIVRSLKPGEGWLWCFVDRRLVDPAVSKRRLRKDRDRT